MNTIGRPGDVTNQEDWTTHSLHTDWVEQGLEELHGVRAR